MDVVPHSIGSIDGSLVYGAANLAPERSPPHAHVLDTCSPTAAGGAWRSTED
jgi:hypothetical protein